MKKKLIKINAMTLHLIGLGLGSLDDITVRGQKTLAACRTIYLECYTSIQPDVDIEAVRSAYPNAEVHEADREFVENGCDKMLEKAKETDVALLVVGDPFGATTHGDLYLRATDAQVRVNVVHNASILNAIGCTGLQLYRFGQVVSIPFFEDNWRPASFADKIRSNLAMDLHTLVLLDIKVKEPTMESLCKGGPKVYMPKRFMTISQSIEQLLSISEDFKSMKAVGVARLGHPTQKILSGTLNELKSIDFGPPLHSLIICADKLHDIEERFYQLFRTLL